MKLSNVVLILFGLAGMIKDKFKKPTKVYSCYLFRCCYLNTEICCSCIDSNKFKPDYNE